MPTPPGPRWTPAQLQNDNWNMGTLAGHLGDDIKDLTGKINDSHNSAERKELQDALDRKRKELADIQARVNENNSLLGDQGVGADGQTDLGDGGLTPKEIAERLAAAAASDNGTVAFNPPDDFYNQPSPDMARAQGFLDGRDSPADGGGGMVGDDGGYEVPDAALGGDQAGDEFGERNGHIRRRGDHQGRSQSSTGTGDVEDPFQTGADTANQAAGQHQGRAGGGRSRGRRGRCDRPVRS